MKRWFARLPIRRKLFLLIFTTSVVVVTLASTAHLINDYRSMRDVAIEELDAQAQLILDNATTALVFDDYKVGSETIYTLQGITGVRMACLYDEERQLFATYQRDQSPSPCPETAPEDMRSFEPGRVIIVKTDYQPDGRRSGTLLVRTDQTTIQARLENQVVILAIVLLITLAVAIVLSAWLQRLISSPIGSLASTASAVSSRGDYSIRATRTTEDEIGLLVDSFNRMLETIQTRERDLSIANDELRREVAERRRAEQLKDEFLATLSHELRTPLNAILGWTRLLRGGTLPDASVDGALEKVERNARMQARLVDDLLEVSRITTGKLRIEMRPVDLVALARTAIDSVRPAAESRGVNVEWDLSKTALTTAGDPDRLQQVIWNILSNAVKFTPSGGRVTVGLARRGDVDELTVTDTGIGIDAGFLPNVFDSFRQADASATRAYGGLGLGLSIVKQLVELHGGTVAVESHGRGLGSRFTVRLPVRSAGAVHEPYDGGQLITPGALAGCSVIVVDDDPDTRELLRSTLETAGASVAVAASADEALAIGREGRADAIVSDLGMPGRDGFSLMEEVRAMPPDLRPGVALALSAYASPRDVQRSLEAGFQDHIAKPVDPGILVHTLRQRLLEAKSRG